MTIEAWITIGTILLVIIALMSNRISPDVAMMGGLTLLLLIDGLLPGLTIVDPATAMSGFAERAVIMIGAIYVVAAGLTETGAVKMIANWVLGSPKSLAGAQVRMMVPVAIMSAFMNTTAVVAMYLRIIADWSRKQGFSAAKLYMPLSFAAILGGTCTLIGTSSNITISGLYSSYIRDPENQALVQQWSLSEPAFWWIAVIGVPSAVIGIVYIVIGSRWLLADRQTGQTESSTGRQYRVEMRVQPDSPVVGRTIEEAGLRHLPGLYLADIDRGGHILPAVGPDERLRGNDILNFVGVVGSVVDLRKIRGLEPATDQTSKVRSGRRQKTLVEAVVSSRSPLVGRTVRENQFRTRYNAAIIAVHRHGQLIERKIGDIRLRAGDTLLLETHAGFVSAYRDSAHFYLISQVEDAREIRHERAWLSIAILVLLVVLLIVGTLDRMVVALVCAGLMVGTRCCTGTIARNSVNWQVLVVIGAAIGIGRAVTNTGAAAQVADTILGLCDGLPDRGFLIVLYLLTSAFAQMVSNNGAAVLMFPIAMAMATSLGVNPEPFLLCLMSASACSFITPIAYQTNLMVYGPGGYRFLDYTRFGLPLLIIVCVLSAVIAPLVFPFHP